MRLAPAKSKSPPPSEPDSSRGPKGSFILSIAPRSAFSRGMVRLPTRPVAGSAFVREPECSHTEEYLPIVAGCAFQSHGSLESLHQPWGDDGMVSLRCTWEEQRLMRHRERLPPRDRYRDRARVSESSRGSLCHRSCQQLSTVPGMERDPPWDGAPLLACPSFPEAAGGMVWNEGLPFVQPGCSDQAPFPGMPDQTNTGKRGVPGNPPSTKVGKKIDML